MCRTLHSSGISRCFWLASLLGLFVFGACSAEASTCYDYQAGYSGAPLETAAGAALLDEQGYCNGGGGGCTPGCTHGYQLSLAGTAPSYTLSGTCLAANGNQQVAGLGLNHQVATCPQCPTGGAPQQSTGTAASINAIPQVIVINDCTWRATGVGTYIPPGAGGAYAGAYSQYYSATGDAANDTSAPSGTPAAPSNSNQCITAGGTTTCLENAQNGCGTFNGDEVCTQAVAPGQCVGYQSGGVACGTTNGAVPPSPPAPGTGGVPDAPTGDLEQTTPGASLFAGPTQTLVATYYNGATVAGGGTAGSTTPAGGAPIGAGNPGSGSGTGTGTGNCGTSTTSPCSVTNAAAVADGDCASSDCSVSGNAMPTYDWSSDSWSGALSSFWGSVAAGPIATAVDGISSNWPSGGSCPSLTVPLGTLSMTADYGTTFCNLWESAAAPVLTGVMLAVWSIVAVFIFMSA